MAFEIRRVRQHQVGERDRFRIVGVDVDDVRNPVLAARRRVRHSICRVARRVHRRVPAHVGHEQQQRVDAVRDRRRTALRITFCSMPCAANGCSHENALSMRRGWPSASTSEILGRVHVAERTGIERAVRPCASCRAGSPAAPVSDTAAGSGSCPACRSRRAASAADAACGRCGSRSRAPRCRASRASTTGRPIISACSRPQRVGPRLIGSGSPASNAASREFAREAADGVGGDAAAFGDRFGRVFVGEIALGEELERGHRACGRRRACIRRRSAAIDAVARCCIGAARLAPCNGRVAGLVRGCAAAHSACPSASRAIKPSSAAPGARITRWCALV